jgi:phage tail sheath protein FI
MPEYLSPGVFIEEIPARLKAIEGVSTSTAGFVGESLRGIVPGWTPQRGAVVFGTQNGLQFVRDDAPVLVTSFGEYRRWFGAPPDDPTVDGYMGHAVRGFFENGGKRAYIARVPRPTAQPAFHQVVQRAILRLTRQVRPNPTAAQDLFLNALTGLDTAATFSVVVPNGGVLPGHGNVAITAYNPQAGSIRVAAAAITTDLDPDRVAIRPNFAGAPPAGPRFWARSPGVWGNDLRILITSANRPAVRITGPLGGPSTAVQVQSTGSFYAGASVRIDDSGSATEATVVDIQTGGTLVLDTAVTIAAAPAFVTVQEIDITILDVVTGAVEAYKRLSWNSDPDPAIRRRHYSSILNSRSRLVFVEPTWGFTAATTATLADEMPPRTANQPMSAFGFPAGPVAGTEDGTDGTPIGPIVPTTPRPHIVGIDNGPGQRTGIQSLQDIDDVRIIAAPGETDPTIQNELITQAERMRYRFAVLDAPPEPGPANVVNQILAHRNAYDSSFAGYYTPWVQIGSGDQTLFLPPSGHVAGVYARTDNERGVWKAPANEVVRGITGMRFYITPGEQDILNPRGVNAIRRFEGRGIRVWGARTLSSDPEYRYVNVRRFLIFMEASIDRGTQWVVFEPNSPETWSRVTDSVSAFLHTQWRSGALFGRRPEDAFFVRCDETTMTVDDVQNGRLICEIGVAIVRPAEFVIFRIEQITGFGART